MVNPKVIFDSFCTAWSIWGVQDHVHKSYYSHMVTTQECGYSNPAETFGYKLAAQLQAQGHSIHMLLCARADGHVIPGRTRRVDFAPKGQPADFGIRNDDWPPFWTWYSGRDDIMAAAAPMAVSEATCKPQPKIVHDATCIPWSLWGVQDHVHKSYYSHLISTTKCFAASGSLGYELARKMQVEGHSIHLIVCADERGHVIPGRSTRVDFPPRGQPHELGVVKDDWPTSWRWYSGRDDLVAAAQPLSVSEEVCNGGGGGGGSGGGGQGQETRY